MNQRKRDKKKFVRQNLRIKNVGIDVLDSFVEHDIVEDKRSQKKLLEKSEVSQKSETKLRRGRVIEVLSNNRCRVEVGGQVLECAIGGRLKQINYETRSIITAGDYVHVDITNLGSTSMVQVEEILPRSNVLSRFSEGSFQTEVVLAANIDQVIITASICEPDINFNLIDRYLCRAALAGLIPIICINKMDLADDAFIADELTFYEDHGFQSILVSAETGRGMDALKSALIGKDSLFSGSSGTGKSTLINRLEPGINLRTGEVSDYNFKGMHTTTSTKLIPWSFGGHLVDSPGIKTFGLHRSAKDFIPRIFPGFDSYYIGCKFHNCTHIHEDGCAVKAAVMHDDIPQDRYESYLNIMASL
ncbi:MAG: ribosome small subunit-dependent GTPase A [Candidatus Cloacimonetes bacterium]|nr:ribosome small subunit-dependent GTPase A [Candidatus Cloacimonadota bacterium]